MVTRGSLGLLGWLNFFMQAVFSMYIKVYLNPVSRLSMGALIAVGETGMAREQQRWD